VTPEELDHALAKHLKYIGDADLVIATAAGEIKIAEPDARRIVAEIRRVVEKYRRREWR